MCLCRRRRCCRAWQFGLQRTGRICFAVFRSEPKYLLLGGVLGAGITWTVIKAMAMLGPARAVLFIVVAQIAAAYLVELFGLFGVEKAAWEWRKAIGLAVAAVGIAVFQWK